MFKTAPTLCVCVCVHTCERVHVRAIWCYTLGFSLKCNRCFAALARGGSGAWCPTTGSTYLSPPGLTGASQPLSEREALHARHTGPGVKTFLTVCLFEGKKILKVQGSGHRSHFSFRRVIRVRFKAFLKPRRHVLPLLPGIR